MTPAQIEDIARRKVRDYMEDIIIRLAVDSSDDPEKLLQQIVSEALLKCNYDDPTIEKPLYGQLQEAIKRNLGEVLESMARKSEVMFESL